VGLGWEEVCRKGPGHRWPEEPQSAGWPCAGKDWPTLSCFSKGMARLVGYCPPSKLVRGP